jgi:hypothetical protein
MKLRRKLKLSIGLLLLAAFGTSVSTSCITRTCYKPMPPIDNTDSTVMHQKPIERSDLVIKETQKEIK